MSRILLVEDDPEQARVRRLLLERCGHQVDVAGTPEECLERVAAGEPGAVVMDLRMPAAADGLRLIRELRAQAPKLHIVVLTGYPEELEEAPEARLVEAVLRKPAPTERLLGALARQAATLAVLLLAGSLAWAQTFEHRFTLPAAGEATAQLELSSPGSRWDRPGAEAALAEVSVDGREAFHVMLFAGERRHRYGVFLGPLAAGAHTMKVSRHPTYSARASGLVVHGVETAVAAPGTPAAQLVAHAPVLYARANTIGRFSDIPLLAYCERKRDAAGELLEYTIVFSNEDGGTSTRDLMARWGRAVDIEFVYRVWLDAAGAPLRAEIQTKDHKEVAFGARRESLHPLLLPITDNNMVAGEGSSPVRYQLLPVEATLDGHSREAIMDGWLPEAYAIAARELEREGKLRPAGKREDERIADPRQYLVVELRLKQRNSVFQVLAKLRGGARWYGSSTGVAENFISREGWVRQAIELPPGVRAADIEALGWQCMLYRDARRKDNPRGGGCVVEQVGKVFLPRDDYTPGETLFRTPAPPGGWSLEAGEMIAVPIR